MLLDSVQSAKGDLLLERFGLGAFTCRLGIEGRTVRYEFQRAYFAGLPFPRRLGPVVNGWVVAGGAGWLVVVHVFVPLLGEVLHYEGWVEPL